MSHPNEITDGDTFEGGCQHIARIPFGQVKNEEGTFKANYGASLEHEAPDSDEKENVVSEHQADDIVFCETDDDGNDLHFMQKNTPLIGHVGGTGFGIRVEQRLYHSEQKGFGCSVCSVSTTEVDLIITKEQVEWANPAVNLRLVQEVVSPDTGWNFATQPWDLDVNTGLANLGPDDGSAYAIFGEWNMILNYYWFNGLSARRYNTPARLFPSWIKRTNSTGSCQVCDTSLGIYGGGGQAVIGGGRCLSVHANSGNNHCGEDFDSPTCAIPKFPITCLSFNPFSDTEPVTNFTPYSVTFEIIFLGFTQNGNLLEWDHPLSNIPQEVWFPEG